MVGAGSTVFAVWGYVIARQKPDKDVGSQVELKPWILAFIFGEPEGNIQKAIDYLCSPDPRSNNQEEKGCRLVKIGTYSYRVVSGKKYLSIRTEEDRRETNRTAQVVSRARKRWRERGLPLAGEVEWVEATKRGASDEELDAIAAKYSKQEANL